jgi:hypothetical protein
MRSPVMRSEVTGTQVMRAALASSPPGLLRQARRDALFIALALAHGAALVAAPSIAVVAVGLWWNANTVAHNFIHRPFFRARAANAAFSCYLSLLLGFPQTLWRERHLAHHAGRAAKLRQARGGPLLAVEAVIVTALWGAMLAFAPTFALTVYLPGYVLGLGLCHVQGRYEHARGAVSHYGRVYNFLFFNDGYHAEHHARPGEDWRRLPEMTVGGAGVSRWPAVLRWAESLNLCALERLVLRSARLQRFVLRKHERAFRQLLPALAAVESVGIVGGGLFPRTALILRRLLPTARLTLIDLSAENLQTARAFLNAAAAADGQGGVEFVNDRFDSAAGCEFDLLIIPLAFVGDRAALYRQPPVPAVLVHDWAWRRRGKGAVVSWLLVKRLNLVRR